MHYVICYDLENDRLREKAAKILIKLGCDRVQKSVFVAAHLKPRHLDLIKASLTRLFARGKVAPQDSLLIVPLPEEQARHTWALGGLNNILAATAAPPLKKLL